MFFLKRKKRAIGEKVAEAPYPRQLEELNVVDFYSVSKLAYVMIYRDERGRLIYKPVEPPLSESEASLLSLLYDLVVKSVYIDPALLKYQHYRAEEILRSGLTDVIKKVKLNIDSSTFEKMYYYLRRDLIGYGSIDVMYNDPNIEDISCAGVESPVYVFHLKYEWLPTTVVFNTREELNIFARKLAFRAGQDITYAHPIVEGPLPPKDYRAHIVLDIVTRRGTSFTIRGGRLEDPFTVPRLVELGTISSKIAAYLWMLVSNNMTILIAGPMASGKTTLLNAIASLIPPQKKIVTIEEVSEIRLTHKNWVPLIARPSTTPEVEDITLYELLKSSLRQRPDYIIIGEIRGKEAYTFFQALSVGHGGLGTIHSESFEQLIKRLENEPLNIPIGMIPLVNTVVIMRRFGADLNFMRKAIEVIDILGFDASTNTVRTATSFGYNAKTDAWIEAQIPAGLYLISSKTGEDINTLKKELEDREQIIKWMVKNNLLSRDDVTNIVEEYHYYPERVKEKVKTL